jgi:NAD(P)-dependent dehydrogenase (short-subunit alcohol dehydrogenase family)
MPLAGLAERVIIVTGGTSGIGRAVVERLLAEDARVVLIGLHEASVARACAELADPRVLGVAADVSTEDGTEEYFAAAIRRFGRVDGLHANAGIAEPASPIAETLVESFDKTIAVNLRGVFLALRTMLQTLAAQRTPGTIVTTSSPIALKGLAGAGAYSASKAAVISLTQTAALEAGPLGHRVNAVLPGPTETPWAEGIAARLPADARDEFWLWLRSLVPIGRMAHAYEVAALVVWLLSDESSFANGGIYPIDGGQSAG